jgi:hypothetical protein
MGRCDEGVDGDPSCSSKTCSSPMSSCRCWLRKPSFSTSDSPRLRIRVIDVDVSIPRLELRGQTIIVANRNKLATRPEHSRRAQFQARVVISTAEIGHSGAFCKSPSVPALILPRSLSQWHGVLNRDSGCKICPTVECSIIAASSE